MTGAGAFVERGSQGGVVAVDQVQRVRAGDPFQGHGRTQQLGQLGLGFGGPFKPDLALRILRQEFEQLAVLGLGPGPVGRHLLHGQSGGSEGVTGGVFGVGAAGPENAVQIQAAHEFGQRRRVVLGREPQQVAQIREEGEGHWR